MLRPSIFGENLFDDFFNDWNNFPFFNDKEEKRLEKKLYGHRAKDLMKTDIRETKDAYELAVELPGFKKEEVKVSLEDGYLTIQAEKGLEQDEKEKKTDKYLRRERYEGACERSFYVGEGVKQEDIKGEYKHGLLKLTIPKKEDKPAEETKSYITIEG